MRTPLTLLTLSLGALVAARLATGGWLSDAGLLALVCVAASVALFALPKRKRSRNRGHAPLDWVVIDGSNVLFWNPAGPSLETVGHVLVACKAQGKEAILWFDANVGYRVGDRWLGPEALANLLNYPGKRIFVAPKGQPADPLVLAEAAARGASVITNDRYRDWADAHPLVRAEGFLIRGAWRDAGPQIDWPRPVLQAA